ILYEKVNGFYWEQRGIIFRPTASYTFNVLQPTIFGVAAVFGGCESTKKEFTLSPGPQIPSVAGNLQVCQGQSTTLTATGASGGSYRWYNGTTLISGVT